MPMRCTKCFETKDEKEFYLSMFGRFAAWCADCRIVAALAAGGQPKSTPALHRPPRNQRLQGRLETLRERTGYVPAPGPNVTLIQDASVARDLAWFFELNPNAGARRADNR